MSTYHLPITCSSCYNTTFHLHFHSPYVFSNILYLGIHFQCRNPSIDAQVLPCVRTTARLDMEHLNIAYSNTGDLSSLFLRGELVGPSKLAALSLLTRALPFVLFICLTQSESTLRP